MTMASALFGAWPDSSMCLSPAVLVHVPARGRLSSPRPQQLDLQHPAHLGFGEGPEADLLVISMGFEPRITGA
jgi:hypothetical protein